MGKLRVDIKILQLTVEKQSLLVKMVKICRYIMREDAVAGFNLLIVISIDHYHILNLVILLWFMLVVEKYITILTF